MSDVLSPRRFWLLLLGTALFAPETSRSVPAGEIVESPWKKHVVHTGSMTQTAVAADFTGDGRVDVVSNSDGKARLFVAPDWREVILHDDPQHRCIHSEILDVDRDGDPDYVAARYNPGLIYWLERPDGDATTDEWTFRLVDDQVHGIHGLLVGDVDQDGNPDLIANSAQPKPPFPNSIAWFATPRELDAPHWPRRIAADGDAPGLSHYLGLGDVNGDGRPDVASAAKGGPQAEPGTGDWFAWWEAPEDPRDRGWKKHLVAADQPGATNIIPADVNADGQTDLVCSRGHGDGVLWFEGPDWEPHDMWTDLTGPHCLAVDDIDGDGDLDAATCAKDDMLAVWFENDGRGHFTSHVVGRNQAAYDIRTVDMDGDEDLDLLVAGQASQNVVWYENPQ